MLSEDQLQLETLADDELEAFVLFCVHSIEHLLTDKRSKRAATTIKRFFKGEATPDELNEAHLRAKEASAAINSRPLENYPSYADFDAALNAANTVASASNPNDPAFSKSTATASRNALAAESVRSLAAGRSPRLKRAYAAALDKFTAEQAEWLRANPIA